MTRILSHKEDYDEEVTFNKQRSTQKLTEESSDDDIVYHRKYLKKKSTRESKSKDNDDAMSKLTDSSAGEETVKGD